jgi:catechol 2,3-dioxygenase-like lactoylglutathione lyase family enzyme
LLDDRDLEPLPASQLRIARPSRDLRASERFWVEGLGLEVLLRADSSAEGGHALLMAGWPDAVWHLELVGDPHGETPRADRGRPAGLYLNGEVDASVVRRLVDARHPARRAQSLLGSRGVTVVDPDGYRLVLTSRSWP